MKISDEDEDRLDEILGRFIAHLSIRGETTTYKKNSKYGPGSGYIELESGILVPELPESVLVMDKEYLNFLLQLLAKFFVMMQENTNNPLFGFAERSLYEFITLWVFLASSNTVKDSDSNRIKSLLWAGHYRYMGKDGELDTYLKQRGGNLSRKDLQYLNNSTASFNDYSRRLWDTATEMKQSYGQAVYEAFLLGAGDFGVIASHQSMRVHANPLSVNENLNNTNTRVRRKLLLIVLAGQVCDYLTSTDDKTCNELLNEITEFRRNLITEIGN